MPESVTGSVGGRAQDSFAVCGALRPTKAREGVKGTTTRGAIYHSDLRASAEDQRQLTTCF